MFYYEEIEKYSCKEEYIMEQKVFFKIQSEKEINDLIFDDNMTT